MREIAIEDDHLAPVAVQKYGFASPGRLRVRRHLDREIPGQVSFERDIPPRGNPERTHDVAVGQHVSRLECNRAFPDISRRPRQLRRAQDIPPAKERVRAQNADLIPGPDIAREGEFHDLLHGTRRMHRGCQQKQNRDRLVHRGRGGCRRIKTSGMRRSKSSKAPSVLRATTRIPHVFAARENLTKPSHLQFFLPHRSWTPCARQKLSARWGRRRIRRRF